MKRRLPKRLHLKHGAYYYVCRVREEGGTKSKVKWQLLSKDYGEALRKWAELEGGKVKVKWTVADALAEYLRASEKRLRPATLLGYREAAKRLLAVFGPMAIEDLTKAQVYTYVVKRGNYAGNRERGLISATYAHLIRTGVFTGSNPAAGMGYRHPEKPRKRYLTDAELEALLAAASPRMRLLFTFAYLTGMRQADVIGLKLTSATDDGILYTVQKTGEPHLIAWTDELRAIWRQAAGSRIGAQHLFLDRDRKAYTGSAVRQATLRIAKRAKLSDVHFHDLRRKAGSDSADLASAQALLSHANSKITQRHYRAKLVAVKPLEMPTVRQKPKC